MATVTHRRKPDCYYPWGRDGATHEETADGKTACCRVIGSEREGWVHAGRKLDCKACLRALAVVEACRALLK